MPRRRELADVADGITGHLASVSSETKRPPLAGVAYAIRAGHGTEFVFDLLDGIVEPPSRYLAAIARVLQDDLQRHLRARRIDPAWVSSAVLTVTISDTAPADWNRVSCRVAVTDDRAVIHTSTRRAVALLPRLRCGLHLSAWVSRAVRGR